MKKSILGKELFVFDISWPLHERTVGYKNEAACAVEKVKEFSADRVRKSRLTISSHAGTHIDAPSHFLQEGKTVDTIPLSDLMGVCKVVDFSYVKDTIGYDDFVKKSEEIVLQSGDILLCKTRNSGYAVHGPFVSDFVFINASGATYCVEKKIRAIGIDYLGIERLQPNHPTHKTLLANNIWIIEGIRLAQIIQGVYTIVCLPLAVVGTEAVPARAILLQ